VSDPPVSDPPVSDPPVSDPPVSDPPVSEPPVSEPPAWDTLLGWAAEGQRQAERAAGCLDPAQVSEPSRLPGWSRGHVLSHLARNADALTNLLTWARTGIESRMYASPDERAEGISAGAHRGLPEQLADLAASGSRFLAAAAAVPPERRSFPVVSGQGRQIPAREVPWLRVREVWLHLVDLDAGYDIDVLPDAVAWTLAQDVAAWMTPRSEATVELRVEGHGIVRLGPGVAALGPGVAALGPGVAAASIVEGSAQRIAGWLTGRAGPAGCTVTGGVPDLPRWL
jgi:maleylpyruvate isomerase